MIRSQDVRFAAGGHWLKGPTGVLTRRLAPIWRGGEELKETHTCASTAAYHDRDGYIRGAAIDCLRPHWFDRNADGVMDQIAVLLEEVSTNLITQSEDFSTWFTSGTPVLTSGQASPDGGTNAYLIEDDDGASNEDKQVTAAFTGDGEKVFFVHAKQSTATGFRTQVRDATAAVVRHAVNYTWDGNGVPVGATASGTGTIFTPIRIADGWWICPISATGVVAANTNRCHLFPCLNGLTGATYFFGAQAENATFPSSYKKTAGGAVTRNRNVLSFPLYVTPGKNVCVFHRHIELDVVPFLTLTRLWSIGAADASNPRFSAFRLNGGDSYRASIVDAAAASVTSTIDANPAYRDRIDTRTIYDAAAKTIRLGVAKEDAAESLGPLSSVSALTSALWSGPVLNINGVGTSGVGRQGWIATVVATYEETAPSMDDFREWCAF